MIELNEEDVADLLGVALSRFRSELGSEVTAVRILTLLAVYKNPGMNQSNLSMFVEDLSQQGLSRNVLDLSARTASGSDGPDLVSTKPDPAFRRKNVLSPTLKAAKLLTRVTADLNKIVRQRAKAG